MITVGIKTLTPLHIGSGRELTENIEFIGMKEEIGVIDIEKVYNVIGKENIDRWLAIIENEESILDYLKKRKQDITLEDVCSYTIEMCYDSSNSKKTGKLKQQIHDGMGNLFIPGSSIKGAIRTVLLYSLQNEAKRHWSKLDIVKNLKVPYDRIKVTDRKIQSYYFGKDPNTDFMRFVKIGDAFFSDYYPIALPMLSMNCLGKRIERDKKLTQFIEAIGTECESTFRMKIDWDLWKKNIIKEKEVKQIPAFLKDYTSFFKAINNYTSNLLKGEIDCWEQDNDSPVVSNYIGQCKKILSYCNNCKNDEAVLRVGHGSGWIFMTGGWVKDRQFIDDDVYDLIVDKSRPKNFRYKDYFFPKTRRMDVDGELCGFVKLSIA